MMETLCCSWRTLYRYLRTLRDAGPMALQTAVASRSDRASSGWTGSCADPIRCCGRVGRALTRSWRRTPAQRLSSAGTEASFSEYRRSARGKTRAPAIFADARCHWRGVRSSHIWTAAG